MLVGKEKTRTIPMTVWMPELRPLWCKASRQLAKMIWGVLGKGVPEEWADGLGWFMS